MADQIQTDESISLVTALDEMRIVSENGFKKVEHLVIQGDHMKGKLQEMINKNDQMSELIRATYPGTALGNDTGDNDTGHRSVPVSYLWPKPSSRKADSNLLTRLYASQNPCTSMAMTLLTIPIIRLTSARPLHLVILL